MGVWLELPIPVNMSYFVLMLTKPGLSDAP